jgi:hypothetical protein
MRKRLNLIVLVGEILCIVVLHSVKTNHSEKNNTSFTQKLMGMGKFQSLRSSLTISALK